MTKPKDRFQMTDRERALITIIRQLYGGNIPHWFNSAEKRKTPICGSLDAGFDPTREAQKGDLVLCSSNCNHFAGVAIYVEPMEGYEKALLRSLGSDDLMEMENEKFIPIVGVDLTRPEFYYGEQRGMYEKVLKAFNKGDEWAYKFGGLVFDNDKVAINVRPHIFLGEKPPITVAMDWSKKTTIKQILNAMVEAGYGVAWEPVKEAQ